jgi:hypothetical protein
MKIIALEIPYHDCADIPTAIVIAEDEFNARQLLCSQRNPEWLKARLLWAYKIAEDIDQKILSEW